MRSYPLLIGRRQRVRGWRRHCVVAVLAMILIVVGGTFYMTRPKRLARLASQLISSLTGADVEISRATLSLAGQIELERLQLRLPADAPGLPADLPDSARRLFEADRLLIRYVPLALLSRQLEAKSLTLVNPTLYITEHVDEEAYNFQYLYVHREDEEPVDMPRAPDLMVHNLRIQFGQVIDGDYARTDAIMLNGDVNRSPGLDRVFDFELWQTQGPLPTPAVVGRFNLETLAVDAQLKHFSFAGGERNMLPRRLRPYWDQLAPAGDFPLATLSYDPNPDAGLHAAIDIRNASVTLPMTDGRGRVSLERGRLSLERDLLRIEQLEGHIEDYTYQIHGQMKGIGAEGTFELTTEFKGQITDQPRYLAWIPFEAREAFDIFTPRGDLSGRVTLRGGAGQSLEIDGEMRLADGAMRYRRFPYPVRDIDALFRFTHERFDVVSVTGVGITGGECTAEGYAAPPGDEAELDLMITGRGIPLNEYMYEALGPRREPSVRMLFSEPDYQRLTDPETGVLQRATSPAGVEADRALDAEAASDRAVDLAAAGDTDQVVDVDDADDVAVASAAVANAKPVFTLGGVGNFNVRIYRPLGADKEYDVVVHVDLAGLSIMMEPWPYPLNIHQGELEILDDKVLLKDVRATGVTGGNVKLGGVIEFRDGENWPDIPFEMTGFPVNDVLLASLNDASRQLLESLNVEGAIDATGRVHRDRDDIDFDAQITLADATARPNDGGYVLENVAATLHVTGEQTQIQSATATHGDATFTIAGGLTPDADSDGLNVELKIQVGDLAMEDPFASLIPADSPSRGVVEQLVALYKPVGVTDVLMELHVVGEEVSVRQLSLEPSHAAFNYGKHRVELRDIDGSVDVAGDVLHVRKLAAAFGEAGGLRLDGSFDMADAGSVELNIEAFNDMIDVTTRALLPTAVLETIDKLELKGGYHLRSGAWLRQAEADGFVRTGFTGEIRLEDASAHVGVPVTNLFGQLRIDVFTQPEDDWPQLQMELDADELMVLDRVISPLAVKIVNGRKPDTLDIVNMAGESYTGRLMGKGWVKLGRPGQYDLRLTLQDGLLDPLLDPKSYTDAGRDLSDTSDEIDREATGKLSIDLTINGQHEDARTRRGRGTLEIRDASMQRLPVALAVLQLLNLNLPLARSFNAAQAVFLIDGHDIHIDSLKYIAPTLVIEGAGDVNYDTRKVDLTMRARNPEGMDLGVISEFLNVFKDQLINIRITGTMDEPKAALRSLEGVGKTIDDVLGRD